MCSPPAIGRLRLDEALADRLGRDMAKLVVAVGGLGDDGKGSGSWPERGEGSGDDGFGLRVFRSGF